MERAGQATRTLANLLEMYRAVAARIALWPCMRSSSPFSTRVNGWIGQPIEKYLATKRRASDLRAIKRAMEAPSIRKANTQIAAMVSSPLSLSLPLQSPRAVTRKRVASASA